MQFSKRCENYKGISSKSKKNKMALMNFIWSLMTQKQSTRMRSFMASE